MFRGQGGNLHQHRDRGPATQGNLVSPREEGLDEIQDRLEARCRIPRRFSHDLVTGIAARQVTLIDKLFLVARIVVKGSLGQAQALCDVAHGRRSRALEIEQARRLGEYRLQLDVVLVTS